MLQKLFYPIALLGLSVAFLTLWLKWYPAPCFVDGCLDVINSEHASILGIPVSVYGILTWILLIAGNQVLKYIAAFSLVVGSAYFVIAQYFLIGSFCVFCLIHAAFGFLLIPFLYTGFKHKANAFSLVITPAIALALSGGLWYANNAWSEQQIVEATKTPEEFKEKSGSQTNDKEAVNREHVTLDPQSVSGKQSLGPDQTSNAFEGQGESAPDSATGKTRAKHGIPWLSKETRDNSALVISLACEHCMSLIEGSMSYDFGDAKLPPMVFYTNPETFHKTASFLAAYLASKQTPSDFTAVFSMSRGRMSSMGNESFRSYMASRFQGFSGKLPKAEKMLKKHANFTDRVNITATPMLITDKGGTVPSSPSSLTEE